MRHKWGLSWIAAEVDPIPLSSFMSFSLHFWLDHVALTFGDSSLKARHGKEARGVPWDAADEALLLGSFDLLLRMEGQ